ncbi:winged helix-turn-helix transcriptional regulator [Clostridium gasigenes]|uniref:autorepressor SdpR family transcription factor n=1 Tax=Clostridium gasigenes TaxID=94869 RepID=UPI0014386AD3|nr:autorepressor SdpR family transcription factor [Clostridium gasigenes]MBU3134185.1 autorepressor SdpR family transcription factor [Clostridium gasigenes]NKF08031.1 winged helix-turn-helix transcriptional regulator [Clostridium gasigenes]QSW20593.1 winged helix-turn-helix transcriptional regulator [Clostridium gasigenes]
MIFQNTFKALSDPTRREILIILKDGKKSAGDIAGKFEMTQATVSHHLSILKKADLITEEKKWKYVYYELNVSVFEEVMMWLSQFNFKGED